MPNILPDNFITPPNSPSGKTKNIPKIFLPVLAFLLIGLVVLLGIYLLKVKGTNKPLLRFNKPASQNETPALKVQQEITKTFADSAKFENIITLTEIASAETDIDKRYDLFLEVFNKIKEAYLQTKDPTQKLALYNLQDYLNIYPQYRQSGTDIPQ